MPIGSGSTHPETLRDTSDGLSSQGEGELLTELQECLSFHYRLLQGTAKNILQPQPYHVNFDQLTRRTKLELGTSG